MLRGIPWIDIQLMLADMPFHDYGSKDEEKVIEVTTLEQHKAAMKKLKEKRK